MGGRLPSVVLFKFPAEFLAGGKGDDAVDYGGHGPAFLDHFNLLGGTGQTVEVCAEACDEVREFVKGAGAVEFLNQKRDGYRSYRRPLRRRDIPFCLAGAAQSPCPGRTWDCR